MEPQHPDNKTDHVFDHWEKPDGSPYRFDEPMTGDLTVHAVYRRKQYDVQFEKNGSFVSGNMSNQHFNGGETKPLSSNVYTRPGYVFGGWGRTPDAATPEFGDGQTVSNLTQTDGETVKLYAVWTPVTPAIAAVPTVNKQITGDTPHNAGRFTFELSAVSTTAVQSELPMPASAQGNTDRIQVEGASQGNFGNISFRFPGTYVYRIAELPEGRKGFSFDPDEVTLTYIVTQNGLNLNVTTSAQKNGNPVTDATFVNRFTVPDYTITFDGNGSWIRIPTQSVREGNHGTDPQTTMLRTESKFIGWYLNGQPYDFNTPVYDDITLVAMYEYKPSEDNSGGSGGGGNGGGGNGGGKSSHQGGKTTPNTNPLNPGISDTTVVPPVSPTEPSPDLPAEEKRTPHGEAISPTERHKTTVVTGTSKRSKRGKLPKTGEAPISNPLPQLATLTLAAYALLAEEKRRREQTK